MDKLNINVFSIFNIEYNILKLEKGENNYRNVKLYLIFCWKVCVLNFKYGVFKFDIYFSVSFKHNNYQYSNINV